MLTQPQFQHAYDELTPLYSPKGIMVWIDEVNTLYFDDVDSEDEREMSITRYSDEHQVRRSMDTRTFKEVFFEKNPV